LGVLYINFQIVKDTSPDSTPTGYFTPVFQGASAVFESKQENTSFSLSTVSSMVERANNASSSFSVIKEVRMDASIATAENKMADFVGSVEIKMEESPRLMKNNTEDSIVREENKVRGSALVTENKMAGPFVFMENRMANSLVFMENKMADSEPIVGMCSKCGMKLVEIIEVLGKKEKLA
jgi:hypothetical protein